MPVPASSTSESYTPTSGRGMGGLRERTERSGTGTKNMADAIDVFE